MCHSLRNILDTSDGLFFFSDIAVRFGQEVQQMLSRMGIFPGSGRDWMKNSKAFQPRFLHGKLEMNLNTQNLLEKFMVIKCNGVGKDS